MTATSHHVGGTTLPPRPGPPRPDPGAYPPELDAAVRAADAAVKVLRAQVRQNLAGLSTEAVCRLALDTGHVAAAAFQAADDVYGEERDRDWDIHDLVAGLTRRAGAEGGA